MKVSRNRDIYCPSREKSKRNVFLFSSISVLCANFSSVLFNETNDTEEKKTREAERERETK
jgi:hypothetical protein